jgi:hypothetical protein
MSRTTDMLDAYHDIIAKAQHEFISPPELFAAMQTRFPDCTISEVGRVMQISLDASKQELEEAEAKTKCRRQEIGEVDRVYDGLDREMPFEKAVAIKAAQGDPVALKWRAYFASKYYRMGVALLDAAMAKHPLYEPHPKGGWQWLGEKDARHKEYVLIEWFQIAYPAEARKIEEQFER